MKTKTLLFVSIMTVYFWAVSCSTPKTTTLTSQTTKKDSLMLQICKDYIPTSIIGEGGKIAIQEKAQRDYTRNIDRAARLKAIKGVIIKKIPREGDSLCDFVAEMGDILFAYDSFELTDDATTIIDQLAQIIIDIPTKIEVIGHTDNQGDETYNLNLSKMRAIAVGNRLRENGITNITEKGLGKTQPIASNETAEGRQKNRRVEIKMYAEND